MERCRLCFTEITLQLSKNLFDNQQDDPPILDVIAKLTDLKFCNNGPYSKITCLDCYAKLINVYNFRKVILQTDLKFYLKFNNNNDNENCNINNDGQDIMEQNVQIKTEQNCDNNAIEINNHFEDVNKLNDINCIQQDIDKQIESNREIDEYTLVFNKTDQVIGQQIEAKNTCDYVINSNMIKTETNLHDNSNEYLISESHESHENSAIFPGFQSNVVENLSESSCNISIIKDEICDNETPMNSCSSDETQTVDYITDDSNSVNMNTHEGEEIVKNESYFIKESKIEIQEYYPIIENHEINENFNASIIMVRRKRGRHWNMEKRFKCNICGRIFMDDANLKNHLTPNNKKPFKCQICCKPFGCDSSLVKHLETHMFERRFDCNQCDREFKSKGTLDIHIRSHTGEKPFNCDICKEKFISKYKLTCHLKAEHAIYEKPYECFFCYKKFGEVSKLNYHLRSHSDLEKPYKCTYCNKRFSYESPLNVHLRLHTGENLYKCNVCGRGFSQESYLNNHLPVHTAD